MAFKLRKRVLLTIALTVLMLVISNNIWLIRRPIRTEFDIIIAQGARIEVQLNRKDNNEFLNSKTNKASSVVKTNNLKHIIIKNKTSKRAKRFRLEFSNLEIGKTFGIKDISMHYKKCKLDELDKFVAEKADLSIKDKKLFLTPKEPVVTLLYNKAINEKGPIKFEFEVFTIILILSSLFGYKLMDYVADFSSVKHKSRIDIVFLCIFFLMLFIPMSHINQDEISKTENRTLAKWKPLLNNDETLNYNFGKDFESWFNDRFNFRQNLVETGQLLGFYLNTNSFYENKHIVYNKKENFFFAKTTRSVEIITGNNLFNEKELNIIKNNLKTFNDYCNKNGVKLYIFLSNDKESIYPEYYSKNYKRLNNSRIEQLKQVLKSIDNLKVINVYEDLLQEKQNNLLYRRYDTHFNGTGAFIEYKALIKKISEDFLSAKEVDNNDYIQEVTYSREGDCIKHFFLQNKLPKETIIKYNKRNASLIVKKEKKFNNKYPLYTKYFNQTCDNDLKITILGDSFHLQYIDILATDFKQTKSVFWGSGLDFILNEEIIKSVFDEKPNILVIETTERYLPRFLNIDSFMDIFKE